MSASRVRFSPRLFALLFFLALFTYGMFKYFLEDSMTANRTALALAILKDGTIRIDPYVKFSGDICYRKRHYYCDKAPGATFVSFPFIAAAYYALTAAGKTDFDSFRPLDEEYSESQRSPCVAFQLLILAGSVGVSLGGALAVAVLYALGTLLGAPPRTAVIVAVFLGFGTMFGLWSTVLMGHALSGAFLLFGLCAAVYLLDLGSRLSPKAGVLKIGWFGIGVLLAYSFWVEYTAAIPACILGFLILSLACRRGFSSRRIATTAGLMFLGAVPVAVCFCIYNTLAYGSPFSLGYQHVNINFPQMKEGFCGITLPSFVVLLKTLFHSKYGILWFSPALIFFPHFVVDNIRKDWNRELNIACFLIVAYYFLLNSSYAYWPQTYFGPRHCTPCLPFAVIPFLSGWNHRTTVFRRTCNVLVGLSVLIGAIALFVPASPYLYDARWTLFFMVDSFCRGGVRNLLYYAGVPAYLTIAVILAVWGAFAWRLSAECRKQTNDDSFAPRCGNG